MEAWQFLLLLIWLSWAVDRFCKTYVYVVLKKHMLKYGPAETPPPPPPPPPPNTSDPAYNDLYN